ncbi:MAG: DNA replication and repair protein RecF [Coriobacteriia bacterium]|nr:DNA replication and repair protein RecF [Coriobacteriia bacterium]
MSLIVETLTLNGFRSYRDAHLSLDPELTILHGANAAGKTNIIEALQMLTAGESFRKPSRKDLINWESDQACVSLRAADGSLQRDVVMTVTSDSKDIVVNEKKIGSMYELGSVLPCVIFSPDDLRIVKESSSRRRQEIDGLGSQLSVTYARLASEYKKIILQRNKMLKDGQYGSSVFYAWTDRMVEVGLALIEKRTSLFDYLRPHVIRFYLGLLDESFAKNVNHSFKTGIDDCIKMVTDQDLSLSYLSSWGQEKNKESFRATLEAFKEDEIARRQSLVGPHRDDIVFEVEGKAARNFASQGQQRSIALAWKLGQLAVIEELCQKKPLLLLDDVMSEFDQQRRRLLAEMVGKTAQTVITTANLDYFERELIDRAKLIAIPKEVVR